MVHHETEFQKIRPIILERDNHHCQYCGADAKEVHHIDGNRANNKPENLVAICRRCNNQKRKVFFGKFKMPRNQMVSTTKEGFREYMRLYMRHRRAGLKTKFHAPWFAINDPMKTTTKEGKRVYMRFYMRAKRKGEQFTAPWLKRTPEQTTTSKIGKALYMKNYMRAYRATFEEQREKLNSGSLEDFM